MQQQGKWWRKVRQRGTVQRDAAGNKTRKYRNESKVPSRAFTVGYSENWRAMPRKPRMEVASPTVVAGIPRPPVKKNGRDMVDSAGLRGVERNSDHRFVKEPSWKSKMLW